MPRVARGHVHQHRWSATISLATSLGPQKHENVQRGQHENWWHEEHGGDGMEINVVGKGYREYTKGKGKGKCHSCEREGRYKYNCPHKGHGKRI